MILYFSYILKDTKDIRRLGMNLLLSDTALNVDFAEQDDRCYIDLSCLKVASCMGCFGCWTKTPGKCVIRDDAVTVYPKIAESNKVIYVSKVKYGSYDTIMKTMLERSLPIQQAFIEMKESETHHVQRNVNNKEAIIIAYGDLSQKEQQVFKNLVARNALNMNFSQFKVIFTKEKKLDSVVKSEVTKWDM